MYLYNIARMEHGRVSNLDAVFFALSDPTRRAILARLALGEATVMQLTEPFELTQPAISRHLKVLESAELIVRRAEGTKRHCRLANRGIESAERWLESLRDVLAKNYDRLDKVLATAQPKRRKRNR
jgi:DNA-binding transcriptional ArsR family regulator